MGTPTECLVCGKVLGLPGSTPAVNVGYKILVHQSCMPIMYEKMRELLEAVWREDGEIQ